MSQDMRKMIDQIKMINERLGVPDNIVNTASAIHDDLVKNLKALPPNAIISEEDEATINITGHYRVGNESFRRVKFTIGYNKLIRKHNPDNLDTTDDEPYIQLARLFIRQNAELVKNHQGIYGGKNIVTDNIDVGVSIAGTKDELNMDEVINAISNDAFLSSLAHELLHKYEHNSVTRGGGIESLSKYSDYDAYSNVRTGIKPIDELIFYIYYMDKIESVTRPTELFALLKSKNVTKENFQQAVKESEVYQTLNKIKNFSIENIINDLKANYVDEVNQLFDQEADYNKLDLDNKIRLIFKSLYLSIGSMSSNTFFERMKPSFEDMFNSMIGDDTNIRDKEAMVRKHVSKYEKASHVENLIPLFVKMQKRMNQQAEVQIRKLFKLYDMVPYQNEINENCIRGIDEWILDQEIRHVPKIKFFK